MTIRIVPFDALSLRELYEIMELRSCVFVVGQKITAEPEIDGLDPECDHVFYAPQGGLLGTARLFMRRDPVIVGRIAIAPGAQRFGHGTRMMRAIHEHLSDRRALMHAQAYLEPWYARLGWVREGEPFEEAGIEHVTMWRAGVASD